MKVQEFVNKYNYLKDEKAKEKFISERLKTAYVPFVEKCNICERVARASNLNPDGRYVAHSALNYMLYLLSLVNAYTDIDIVFAESDKVVTDQQYDSLKKTGLLEMLINLIPESEANEFSMLIGCANDDLRSNNCDLYAVVDEVMHRIADNAVAIASLIDIDSIKRAINDEE